MSKRQAWLEFQDSRKRNFADAVWIPLRMIKTKGEEGFGFPGYEYEFRGISTVAIPLSSRSPELKLDWMAHGLHSHEGYAFPDRYKAAEVYQRDEQDFGLELVLDQYFEGNDRLWHLNQDLVIALQLKREGDIWVCPRDGYADVVKLHRGISGDEESIEIRAEYLRDYLAARHMALRLLCFYERRLCVENTDEIVVIEDAEEELSDGVFRLSNREIHKGGRPAGGGAVVFRVWRNDVDEDADVPVMSEETNENTEYESNRIESSGDIIVYLSGRLYKNEWIEPLANSPRVRGDDVPSSCSFIVDAAGGTLSADELNDKDIGRWLWFGPGIVNVVLDRRGGKLQWHSRDTGDLEIPGGREVHFGLNAADLVTVYAYDVARLPEWQRKIWSGFNVAPDGKVSEELLESQVRAQAPRTNSFEEIFKEALEIAGAEFKTLFGDDLIRPHAEHSKILAQVHRFRSCDDRGLFSLAKDIARLTADSFNVAAFQEIAPQEKGGKPRGSLKSLEAVLAKLIEPNRAKRIVAPLFGAYDMRLNDAHLPKSEIDAAKANAKIDSSRSAIRQGEMLIASCAFTLVDIAQIFIAAQEAGL